MLAESLACAWCERVPEGTEMTVYVCGACRKAVYCSELCARMDWNKGLHKLMCPSQQSKRQKKKQMMRGRGDTWTISAMPEETCGVTLDMWTRYCIAGGSNRTTPLFDPTFTESSFDEIKQLGEGSFGSVTLAELHDETKSKVAIKDIRIGNEHQHSVPWMVLRDLEMRNVGDGVSTSGTCKAATFVSRRDNKRHLVLALERANMDADTYAYQTWAEIRDGTGNFPVSWLKEDLMLCAYQMLLGVARCHSRFLCHRDIKTGNFLVSAYRSRSHRRVLPRVELADFGLCVPFYDHPRRGKDPAIRGTPVFMPPELLAAPKGIAKVVPAHDIWSLGITMLEIATGEQYTPGDAFDAIIYGALAICAETEPGKAAEDRRDTWYRKHKSSIGEPAFDAKAYLARADATLPRVTNLARALLRYEPGSRPTVFDVLRDDNILGNAQLNDGNTLRAFLEQALPAGTFDPDWFAATIGQPASAIRALRKMEAIPPPRVVNFATLRQRHPLSRMWYREGILAQFRTASGKLETAPDVASQYMEVFQRYACAVFARGSEGINNAVQQDPRRWATAYRAVFALVFKYYRDAEPRPTELVKMGTRVLTSEYDSATGYVTSDNTRPIDEWHALVTLDGDLGRPSYDMYARRLVEFNEFAREARFAASMRLFYVYLMALPEMALGAGLSQYELCLQSLVAAAAEVNVRAVDENMQPLRLLPSVVAACGTDHDRDITTISSALGLRESKTQQSALWHMCLAVRATTTTK